MEISGNINWKRLDAEAKISSWCLTEESFKTRSMQIFFDSYDVTKTNDTKQGKDTSFIPDVTPKIPEPRIPYPKISDLSIEEQKYFLDTYKEYISGKEIGSESLNQLQNLMWKLSAEQEEVLRFLQQQSLSAKDDYNFLQPQVKKEIQDILQAQRCQVQQNLAPLYSLFQTVGLASGAVFPNDPILCYNRTLKQANGRNLLSLPDVKTRNKSLLECIETDKSTRFQVFQDSTARALARDNASHFVLTTEALQTLIDNHPPEYEKDWELPVTVIDHSKDSNKVTSDHPKTIMIDDPLPPKSITPREANVMFYHQKVCNILRKPSQDNPDGSPVKCRPSVEKNSDVQAETMDIDNDLRIEEDNLKPKLAIFQDLAKDMTEESVDSEEAKSFEDTMCQTKGCNKTNQSITEVQFTYSLWTFGNLNLLIRTNDCGLLYQASKAGKGSLHPVNVSIKPEYQLAYGYEQITTSEASRWWISTYINPDSLCVYARINSVTAQLVRLDVLNQSNILSSSSFDPAKPMKMVHGVLTRLAKLLQPGKYILSHSAKDMHICVYEEMDSVNDGQTKKASYDLHLAHSIDPEFLVNYEKYVPWVPIDPNMFLDWHIAYHRIPLTFPPVSKEELKKLKKRNADVGKKKKKRKKTKNAPGRFKGKGNETQKESKHLINAKKNNQSESNQSITCDKQAENEEDIAIGMSQRLRSRTTPVTYDDIDFDF